MSSDETQFGLKLNGVLRPPVKAEGKASPSTGQLPLTANAAQSMPGAATEPKMNDVTEAAVKPVSPPLAALWRGPVQSGQADDVQPTNADYTEGLEDLSAAAERHRRNRKSGTSRTLYWLMGMGISAVTVGLLICWIYWQPLSALLVGGPVGTASPGTVATAAKSKPSAVAGAGIAKKVVAADQSGVTTQVGGTPQAGAAKVQPAAPAVIQPPAANAVKPVAPEARSVTASLDLDHPFFQRIKGPFPQLFKTSTGN